MSHEQMRTEAKIEVPASTTSSVYLIQADIGTIIVQIIFTTAGPHSAVIETSLATNDEIKAGSTVADDWVIWDDGTITANTVQLTAVAPNAIRVVNSGSSDCIVRIRGNYGR